MILSLRGRLETRLFLTLAVGLPVSILTTALRRTPGGTMLGAQRSNLVLIAAMGLLGLAWEVLYHGLQQLRHDRDWPSLFAFAVLGVEIWPLWVISARLPHGLGGQPTLTRLLGTTAPVWLVMWAFAQGPMRVLFIRWRLHGGRLLHR
jgi:hypothetical protein